MYYHWHRLARAKLETWRDRAAGVTGVTQDFNHWQAARCRRSGRPTRIMTIIGLWLRGSEAQRLTESA